MPLRPKKEDYNSLHTSILSISSKKIKDCNDVVETLIKSGVICSVSSNKSICCDDKKCWIENGCTIILNGLKPERIEDKVWKPLKTKFNLSCAHLEINGGYIGCILNFIEPSKCGWKKNIES